MPEFNLKDGIILRARCLHWKQMDRGGGQQLNAVENVNNVKRHSATQRSNGGSWAVRSRGGSAKRGFRGTRLLTWSKWRGCCTSEWLSSPWNRTSWWQTDSSERFVARTRWKQLFCCYLISGHLEKQITIQIKGFLPGDWVCGVVQGQLCWIDILLDIHKPPEPGNTVSKWGHRLHIVYPLPFFCC